MTEPTPSVCVIGNLLTDLVLRGVSELPAWGHEVGCVEHVSVPSGQAGLLAEALAALGVDTRVISTVGDDHEGRQIESTLAAAGINTSAVEFSEHRRTGLSVVLVRSDGERAFVSSFAALRECDEAMVLRHWDAVAAPIVCLVGLNNLPSLPLEAVHRLLQRARSEGRQTVLDTGWDTGQWQPETVRATRALLTSVDVFLPNLEEARALTGYETPEAAAAALASDGAGVVVIKCGAAGSYAQAGDATYSKPAHAVDVIDTVGAGDVFNAGFLHGYLKGGDVETGLEQGNATAAHYVSRSTNRFPSLQEAIVLAESRAHRTPVATPTARSGKP